MRKVLAAAAVLACAPAHAVWHENLMNNQQLVAASCAELATEERKVGDNAKHAAAAAESGATAGALLSLMSVLAKQGPSGGDANTKLAAEHEKQAKELEQRRGLIAQLQSRKGCG